MSDSESAPETEVQGDQVNVSTGDQPEPTEQPAGDGEAEGGTAEEPGEGSED